MSNDFHDCSGEYCSICGKPATAAWHGDKVIAICPKCATENLPALIADSIVLPVHFAHDHAYRSMNRIKYRFWRALAIRLMREQKKTAEQNQ